MVSLDKYRTHQSHCCLFDGCKYGYEDCPVAEGLIEQDHPCEWCPTRSDLEGAKEIIEHAEWMRSRGFKIHSW